MVKRALYGVLAVFLCLSLGSIASPASAEEPGTPGPDERRVVFVGNNWGGTADLLAPRTFKRLARVNVIPDYSERMAEIATNPYRLAYYLAIKTLIGEGNDQFVDDMYSSNDGRLVVVSRPSFADVVAISLRTGNIVWRFPVQGVRSDHMAVSPNGRHVVVSASTDNVVHVLRVRDGTSGIGRRVVGVIVGAWPGAQEILLKADLHAGLLEVHHGPCDLPGRHLVDGQDALDLVQRHLPVLSAHLLQAADR